MHCILGAAYITSSHRDFQVLNFHNSTHLKNQETLPIKNFDLIVLKMQPAYDLLTGNVTPRKNIGHLPLPRKHPFSLLTFSCQKFYIFGNTLGYSLPQTYSLENIKTCKLLHTLEHKAPSLPTHCTHILKYFVLKPAKSIDQLI